MPLREELLNRPYKAGITPTVAPARGVSLKEELINRPLKTEVERGDSSNSILKTIFREPIELGKELAAAFDPATKRAYFGAQERRTEMLNNLADKYQRGEIDGDTLRGSYEALGEKVEMPEGYEKTTQQVVGDILGTAMWIIPVGEVQALKKATLVARLARGAAIGGVAAATYGMSEDAPPEELAKRVAIGGAIGGPFEAVAPIVFKGMGKLLTKTGRGIKKVGKKLNPLYEWALPVETRLRQLGTFGDELADGILAADRNTLLQTGKRLASLEDTGLYKLTDQEAHTLHDALQGFVSSEKLSPKVKQVYQVMDKMRNEIAVEATALGVKVRVLGRKGWDWKGIAAKMDSGEITKHSFKEEFLLTKAGKKGVVKAVPFIPRKNYYPQFTYDVNALNKGKLRGEFIDNAVRVGKVKTRKEGEMLLDSYIDFVSKGGRGRGTGDYWIKHLINTGQAETRDEARGMTLRFFRPSRNPRYGHLEMARELDFPFYDPDPRRAFSMYIVGATDRLERVKQFGQTGRQISQTLGKMQEDLIRKLEYQSGTEAANTARDLTSKALGVINASPARQRVSRLIRTIQTPKLAFAQMLNIGQSSNTLIASDLPSVAKGIKLAFTQEGMQQALKSGATLESVVREMSTLVGSESKFSSIFLKLTGFSWTEKFNRMVASNAGMTYAQRLLRKLQKTPTDEKILQQLAEFGIDGSKALKVGLGEDELLKAGQLMAEKTQFRARPIDLPALVSSPEGRVLFQFKNFVYNQTRFIYNQTVGELKKGHYSRGVRTLAILSLMFPVTGEVLSDVRSLATGSTRPTNWLRRYFENIGEVGALGIMGDLYTSAKYDSLLEMFAGPTYSTAARTVEELTDIVETGKITDSQKRFFIRQAGITRPIVNYLIPPESPNRKQIMDLFD